MMLHMSKDNMQTTDCPEESVEKFIKNYRTATCMSSVLFTLGMLGEFKKHSQV